MAFFNFQTFLLAGAYLTSAASALTIDTQLVGTWSTKSGKVLTGPVCKTRDVKAQQLALAAA